MWHNICESKKKIILILIHSNFPVTLFLQLHWMNWKFCWCVWNCNNNAQISFWIYINVCSFFSWMIQESGLIYESGCLMKVFFSWLALDVVRAGDSLEQLKTQCGSLKYPERIYATNLRKHCATIAQVSSILDTKWLFEHWTESRIC